VAETAKSEEPTLPRVMRRLHGLDYRDFLIYLGFLAIVLFFAITLRDRGFPTVENGLNIVRQSAIVAIMAVGMVFVLSAGEIDLSIGSVVALAAVVAASLVDTQGVAVAVVAALAVGVAVGLVNGFLVAWFRIPSFLVTLGGMSIVSGVARSVSNLQPLAVANSGYITFFGGGDFGPISSLFVWVIAVVAIGHLVYRKTAFGRQVLATGGNVIAARFSGVQTARIKVSVLVMSATLAALAGLLYVGRLHGARYDLGESDMLTVIAATVIGGTNLFGGRGTVIGAVVGAVLMATLDNGLILAGLSVSDQMIARGVIIVAAVVLSLREQNRG
jgi:ribose transport system permease protein